MTPSQRQRFEALPYGTGVSTDDALTRLEEEVATRGATWRISQKLVLAAEWDERWQAGSWVSSRTGERAQAVAVRANMTPAQRGRLEALPHNA